MLKIGHLYEMYRLHRLPKEVLQVVSEAVTILDCEYGENRNIDTDDGGYVLILEHERDLEDLKTINIDIYSDIPEYVDVITCGDGRIFASVLVLLANDMGIVVIMPISMLVKTSWSK